MSSNSNIKNQRPAPPERRLPAILGTSILVIALAAVHWWSRGLTKNPRKPLIAIWYPKSKRSSCPRSCPSSLKYQRQGHRIASLYDFAWPGGEAGPLTRSSSKWERLGRRHSLSSLMKSLNLISPKSFFVRMAGFAVASSGCPVCTVFTIRNNTHVFCSGE
jgi:hypothetical protein